MKFKNITIILIIMLTASIVISLLIGKISVTMVDLWTIFKSYFVDDIILNENAKITIKYIRFPRIVMATLIGAALAASGAAYQGLFKNPLVSPDILGVSSGASVGAAIAIILSFNMFGVQIMAFCFGLLAVFMVLIFGTIITRGKLNILVMVLLGIVISSLFGALTSLIKYIADSEEKLPEITFWLMGSLSRSGVEENIIIMFFIMIIGAIPLFLIRWKINVLSFGEEEAKALGVNTKLMSLIIIFSSTLLGASSVAICGVVGWVGLVIPHIARMIVGPDYRVLLPTSMIIGSIFLIWVDNIARTLTASEIPLGIITSLVGAPIFVYLLFRGRKGWV